MKKKSVKENRERIRKNSARYRTELSKTHIQKTIWISKTDLDKLETAAIQNEWFAKIGRGAGDIDFQLTCKEILRAGLNALGIK